MRNYGIIVQQTLSQSGDSTILAPAVLAGSCKTDSLVTTSSSILLTVSLSLSLSSDCKWRDVTATESLQKGARLSLYVARMARRRLFGSGAAHRLIWVLRS